MPINIALTAFDVCMLITVIGLLACWLAVLPREEGGALETSVLRVLGVAVALLTLGSFGILVSRTLELNGGSFSQLFADIPLALKVTHYGHVWVWRIPALLLLWLAWGWCLRHRHHRWAAWLMVISAAGIALTRSETGHPADHGDFTFAVWVDWVHLMSAAVWVGSLFGMSLAIFPGLLRASNTDGERSAVVFQRLSTLSGGALAVILASGIYTAIGELGSFRALWTTSYGVTLDVKLGIVILMIIFGAHNRYVKLPRLLRAAGKPVPRSLFGKLLGGFIGAKPAASGIAARVRSCARAVLAESLLGLAVIGAASVLLHGMPPSEMRRLPGTSVPMQMSQLAVPAAAKPTAQPARQPDDHAGSAPVKVISS
ncbi:MAG TPA: CopD family protein [Gammaproteobacteria bacterium]|nr:CopD family protein [Gammaproteobacteria bacterium]